MPCWLFTTCTFFTYGTELCLLVLFTGCLPMQPSALTLAMPHALCPQPPPLPGEERPFLRPCGTPAIGSATTLRCPECPARIIASVNLRPTTPSSGATCFGHFRGEANMDVSSAPPPVLRPLVSAPVSLLSPSAERYPGHPTVEGHRASDRSARLPTHLIPLSGLTTAVTLWIPPPRRSGTAY